MIAITNSTNHINIEEGSAEAAVPKSQIKEIKKKSDHIVIFRDSGAPIIIRPEDVITPSYIDLDDLYATLASYL